MSRALSDERRDVLRVAIALARIAPQTEESTALLAAVEKFVDARGRRRASGLVYNAPLVNSARRALCGWQDRAAGAAVLVAEMALDDSKIGIIIDIGEVVAHAVPDPARAVGRPSTLPHEERPPVYRACAEAVRRLPDDVRRRLGVERHWSAGRACPISVKGVALDARETAALVASGCWEVSQ